MPQSNSKQLLLQIIHQLCYQENHQSPFTLTSGKKSPYYVNLKKVLLLPEYLMDISIHMLDLIMEKTDNRPEAFAGLTMGADPLIYAMSLIAQQKNNNILPLVVRKEPKVHGAREQIEGHFQKVSSVILLDDVLTTGKSLLHAHTILQDNGIQATTAFCVVDREEGGEAILKKHGIDFYSLYQLTDLAELNL